MLDDLTSRGRLETTLVAMFGEFGRTPKINAGAGRDHWSNVFSVMLAGGGLKSGHSHTRPVHFSEILATIHRQLGVSTAQHFRDNSGRPMAVLESG